MTQKMPDEVGIVKFKDGTYDCYPHLADVPPSTKYHSDDKYEALKKEYVDLKSKYEALECSHDRLVGLVDCLVKNEPDDTISDTGHTVLQLWRHDAEKALAEAERIEAPTEKVSK